MADRGGRDREDSERFPAPPSISDVPEAPKIDVKLPRVTGEAQPGSVTPGKYRKVAIATTAASSFVAPILVLGVGGYLLDQRMHNTMALFAFLGTVVGFGVGIFSLLRVIQQLNR
jgi:F0F1-type ATP synthase assembly protein I